MSLRDEYEKNDGLPNEPFPDIVRPGKAAAEGGDGWRKRLNTSLDKASSDVERLLMDVPCGSEHRQEILRWHEMGRARFSPEWTAEQSAFASKLHPMSVVFGEDTVIANKLSNNGIPALSCHCERCAASNKHLKKYLVDEVFYDMPKDKANIAATLWIAVRTSGNAWVHATDEERNKAYIGWYAAYQVLYDSKLPVADKALVIAEILSSFVDNLKKEETTPIAAATSMREMPATDSADLKELLEKRGLSKTGDKEALIKKFLAGVDKTDGVPDWTIPEILHPPLEAVRNVKTYGVGPSDTGAIPKYMHRLPLDKQVFGHRRRKPSATVLVDCSGSMSLTPEMINQLVKTFPAGTVCGYSGPYMVILADGGRMVKPNYLGDGMYGTFKFKGTNECDGPALDWLATRPGKKYWISDMQVTECNDYPSGRAYQYCMRVVKSANVRVFPNVKELLKTKEQIKV